MNRTRIRIAAGWIASILFSLCMLHAAAQEPLHFDRMAWDFGTIREADGPVRHTFTARNTGNEPVVVVEVSVSCGCLRPEFSRKPVLPGGELRLTVTFDPTNRPGRFDKQIGLFLAGSKTPVKLMLTGTVVPREKSVEELYPTDAGGGLRLESNFFAFSYLYHDEAAHTSLGVVNTSRRPLRLAFRPLKSSGFLRIEAPAELAPGQRAEIALRYLVPHASGRYGTVQDVWMLVVDGRESPLPITTHGIAVDSREIVYDEGDPVAKIEPATLRFGEVRRGAVARRQLFTIRNEGGAPLAVRAVELPEGIGCTLRAGDGIPPHGALEAIVTFDGSQPRYGAYSEYITLITNDPIRPMRKVRVTAVLID